MSTTDDLRAIRDLAENISTDLAEIAFRLGGVIERGTDRRAVLAEMTRDEAADGPRADGFPGATSSALGDALREFAIRLADGRWTASAAGSQVEGFADWVDALTAERDRLRDDYDRTAEAADRAAVRLREARNLADLAVTERDEARAEADSLRGQIKAAWQEAHGRPEESILNAVQRLLAERREARNRAEAAEAERHDLRAEIARLGAVIAGDESLRGASWKRLRRDRDAAVAAVGRVRALRATIQGRIDNPRMACAHDDHVERCTSLRIGFVRSLDAALDCPENDTAVVHTDGDEPAQGSTAGGNGARSDAGAAEVSASGPGATRAAEGQESVSGAVDQLVSDLAWVDWQRRNPDATECRAFHAGWQAARKRRDLGGVQR